MRIIWRARLIRSIVLQLLFVITLGPAYSQGTGSVRVTSAPEDGMIIYVDGKKTGLFTPAIVEGLLEGVHTFRLESPYFLPAEQTITVVSGTEVGLSLNMTRAYAKITITSNPDAIIYINNVVKGSTKWEGRMGIGSYRIEVAKDGYTPRELEVTVVNGKDFVVDLYMAIKTGALEVITDPPQAMISLNGRLYGMSPKVISDLPYGDYTVQLEKQQFATVLRKVIINSEKPIKLEVPLLSGREVTINSKPTGASVIINSKVEGETPLTLWLKFGTHVIKLEKGDASIVENITVNPSGLKEYTFELKASSDPFENLMVYVKGGSFKMGDSFGDGNKEEKPVHMVTVDDFYISKFEVTQEQWQRIMGDNPSHFKGCDNCPVERVSWDDTQIFIEKLNSLTGKKYRLPSESEWEYAARGGQESMGYRYAGKNNINFVSWFSGNSENKTHPVGELEPNELGIYDMSGNVWEWVSDWFDFYTDKPKINPKGSDNGDSKLVRGGSWFGYIGGSRVACRGSDDPGNKRSYIGFRLALSP